MNSSHGLMVNYRYDLAQIEHNNLNYVVDGHIAASEDVMGLISDLLDTEVNID